MDEIDQEHKLIREYLIGNLGPERRSEVERRVFADPDYKEKVLSVEEELADEYFNGRMDESLRGEYESRFLATPGQRLDAHIVRELTRAGAAARAGGDELSRRRPAAASRPGRLAASRRSRGPFIALALAAAVVLALAFGWVIVRTWRSGRPEAGQADGSRRAAIERELARLNSRAGHALEGRPSERRPDPPILATLTPGLSRSGASEAAAYPDFVIPAHVELARFRLELRLPKNTYRRFRAAFAAADNRELFEVWLEPDADSQATIDVVIPTRFLEDGEHWIQLSGAGASGPPAELPDHYYYFRVRRR